jgi:hypothetical protein
MNNARKFYIVELSIMDRGIVPFDRTTFAAVRQKTEHKHKILGAIANLPLL